MSPELHPLATPDFEVGGQLFSSTEERLNELFERELDFVWRSLRRLGVPAAAVDDATQQVWLIVA